MEFSSYLFKNFSKMSEFGTKLYIYPNLELNYQIENLKAVQKTMHKYYLMINIKANFFL